MPRRKEDEERAGPSGKYPIVSLGVADDVSHPLAGRGKQARGVCFNGRDTSSASQAATGEWRREVAESVGERVAV